jgi:hypothetical protein
MKFIRLLRLRRKPIRKPLFGGAVFTVLTVYMAVQFVSPVSALDPCQKKLFSSNINYFNCAIDCVSPGGGGGTIKPGDEVPDDQLPGNDVQSKIWNYLIAQGWTPVQAAGIMGNIAVEGVWDPTNIEDPAGSTKDPDGPEPGLRPVRIHPGRIAADEQPDQMERFRR